MKEEDKSKLIEVFTGSPWEAELVKDYEAAMEVVREYEKRENGD